jgi:predicted RNA-binding protein with PIN domain
VSTPPVESLRRALEVAMAIAIAGERERPPVAAPDALRPLLRFTRLPTSALRTVAHALESDDGFRARVAQSVDRDDVGRVAWLWLARPEGWATELTLLLDELALDEEDGGHERAADKALRRRLEGAERARDRALEQAQRGAAELERLRGEAADAVAGRDALASRVEELTARIEELADERRGAVAELERTKALLARRTEEKRELEVQLREGTAAGTTRSDAARSDATPADAARSEADAAADAELVELRRTLEELRARAETFVGDIDALRRDVGAVAERRGGRGRVARRPRRRPAPIPGGLTDDSEHAASHLLGRPNAVLLVDGYNVSMSAWPDCEIADQRARLERMLTDISARYAGLSVELVFDGAEVLPLSRAGARRAPGVTVRFTAAGVEADDALLDLCEWYPHDRPVLVASDDRRVRDGARRRGANTLTARQLLAVARS